MLLMMQCRPQQVCWVVLPSVVQATLVAWLTLPSTSLAGSPACNRDMCDKRDMCDMCEAVYNCQSLIIV